VPVIARNAIDRGTLTAGATHATVADCGGVSAVAARATALTGVGRGDQAVSVATATTIGAISRDAVGSHGPVSARVHACTTQASLTTGAAQCPVAAVTASTSVGATAPATALSADSRVARVATDTTGAARTAGALGGGTADATVAARTADTGVSAVASREVQQVAVVGRSTVAAVATRTTVTTGTTIARTRTSGTSGTTIATGSSGAARGPVDDDRGSVDARRAVAAVTTDATITADTGRTTGPAVAASLRHGASEQFAVATTTAGAAVAAATLGTSCALVSLRRVVGVPAAGATGSDSATVTAGAALCAGASCRTVSTARTVTTASAVSGRTCGATDAALSASTDCPGIARGRGATGTALPTDTAGAAVAAAATVDADRAIAAATGHGVDASLSV
jgi:hypothetical protein